MTNKPRPPQANEVKPMTGENAVTTMTRADVIALMESSNATPGWYENICRVKKDFGGSLPDFWHEAIIASGVADKAIGKKTNLLDVAAKLPASSGKAYYCVEPIEADRCDETPYPGGKDIIKVDGRWGQSPGGGHLIRWLDTGEGQAINLDDCNLVRKYNRTVDLLEDLGLVSFSENEINNISFGNDGDTTELRRLVTVFGEYEKK